MSSDVDDTSDASFSLREGRLGELVSLELRGGDVSLTILPEVGGKIISLRSRVTDREFVWRDPARNFRRPTYGTAFADWDISGIDECLPSIDGCNYPDGQWTGTTVPDHGEVWSLPWEWMEFPDGIELAVKGRAFPYSLTKRIRVRGHGRVDFDYRLENGSGEPFKFNWTGHPLFRAEEGMRILVPGSSPVHAVFALNGRIAVPGAPHPWPCVPNENGEDLDYSMIGPRELNENDKVYVQTPREGWCCLEHPSWKERLELRVPPNRLPWIGICINHGGWPAEAPGYWVAIEPSTTCIDALDNSVRRGMFMEVGARDTSSWEWGLQMKALS